MPASDFVIDQGKTFSRVLRWEAPPIVYRPITGITKSAPVRITCPAHGLPNGWRVTAVSVGGMRQINAFHSPPKDSDYRKATVIDADTVELNDLNASQFAAYTTGGYLQYNTPVDLSGVTARMQIRQTRASEVVLYELNSVPAAGKGLITLDNTAKTLTLLIPVADSLLFTWKTGVYSLEMNFGGAVPKLFEGAVKYRLDPTHD